MANFVAEHDVSTVFIREQQYSRSAVYEFLKRRFERDGWSRLQDSVRERFATTIVNANYEINNIFNDLINQYPLRFAVGAPNPAGVAVTRGTLVKRVDLQRQPQHWNIINNP